jgi:hypothetical protein
MNRDEIPLELRATPERVERVGTRLNHRDAIARVLDQTFAGPILEARPGVIAIGDAQVEVPEGAAIRVTADQDGGPGIEISSDAYPEPPGTWIRIQALAVREAHDVMAQLASDADSAPTRKSASDAQSSGEADDRPNRSRTAECRPFIGQVTIHWPEHNPT